MTESYGEPVVVLMTASNAAEASRIAEALVNTRLAACVQILPEMQSVYRWQGAIARENEVLLLAKTTRERFEELDRSVRAIHSYETPEIVAIPITAGSETYLKWLRDCVSGPTVTEGLD